MASRLLRAHLYNAHRPVSLRGRRGGSSNALSFLAPRLRDSIQSATAPSCTRSSNPAGAPTYGTGLRFFRFNANGRARSMSSAAFGADLGALDPLLAAHRVGVPSPGMKSGLERHGQWEGGRGMMAYAKRNQQAGRRHLSTRRGKVSNQTLTNEQIKAEQVLLVMETVGGTTETTLVSRHQALAAAEAANLDLVQVSANNDRVVCRLMDFKKEQYRKQKQQRATAKKVQKKKEVRLRGMIADHDFERKMTDVKKYLERGDMVKVVLEANVSLLKRSGNCLNDLQERFEAEMEDFEGAVMKPARGGDGFTRREVDCTPRAVKATSPKPSRSSGGPGGAAAGTDDRAVDTDTAQAGQKEKRKPPPPARHVVDEEIVRKVLNGSITAERKEEQLGAPSSSSSSCNLGSEGAKSSDEGFSDESVGDAPPSGDEDVGVEAGAEGESQLGGGEGTPLQVGDNEVWDVELYHDLGESYDDDDDDDLEWERIEALKRLDRRKRDDLKDRARQGDRSDRRGGGERSGRKKWRGEEDDPDGNLDGGDWSEDVGRERRSAARGRGGGRGDGGGRGSGGDGRGGVQGGFARRGMDGRSRGTPRKDSPQGVGGFRRQDGNGNYRDSSGGRGRGVPPGVGRKPPVRTTPYKWRASIAGGNSPTVEVAATAARAEWSRGSGSGDGAARGDDVVRDARGFRARFGGGATRSARRQLPPARGPAGVNVSGSRDADETAAPSDRSVPPPKSGTSP